MREKNNTKICGKNIVCAKRPNFVRSKILACLKRPNFVRSKILACTKRPIFVQSKYFACQKWPDFAQNKPRENILAPQRDGDIRRTGKTRSCDPSGHITPSFEDSASSLLFFPLLSTFVLDSTPPFIFFFSIQKWHGFILHWGDCLYYFLWFR